MDINEIKRLFPGLEDELYQEIDEQSTVKSVKSGDTLLRVGQPIRSTMLILNGIVKLYWEDEEGKERDEGYPWC